MASFLAVTSTLHIAVRNKGKRLRLATKASSFFNRALLKSLGINVRITGPVSIPSDNANYLILSNHVSYLDIFIIFSFFPASFIASVDEVGETFLLGRITELSGGFFVERRSRSGLRTEIESIADLLKMGLNVVLFPEGTTSNGEGVLPFKTPLISIAQKAGVEILPLCIKYRKLNGEEIDAGNRDLVYYYGDMEFFTHCFKMLTVKSIDVELKVLEKIDPQSGASRKEIANSAFNAISSAYENQNGEEKRTP